MAPNMEVVKVASHVSLLAGSNKSLSVGSGTITEGFVDSREDDGYDW